MDDIQQPQEALNPEPVQEPASQQAPAENQQPAAQGAPQTQVDQGAESPKPNRAQRRIGELTHQLREAKDREEQLRNQSLANDFFAQPKPASDPWQQYQSGEISVEQLRNLVNQTSIENAELVSQKEVQKLRTEMATKEYWSDMEADVRHLEASNPKFNPSSPEFDGDYVDELSALYKQAYQLNPNAPKLSQFVGQIEKMQVRAEKQGVERSSAQLAEQAAQGAVQAASTRPGSSTPSQDRMMEEAQETGDFTKVLKARVFGK